ncbi:transport system permease protein [Methanocaldococcus villosus KIN24-T80]|uniref:Transport system permease protein n=1 Tax=Methanocaldococcus villosus KIN24-T80 TaxID=1069083 RepID=N6UWG1_9EURY|nr:iron ABC transporter permease [Methanocaldococcus villosus]ENN96659.1 transport system permease protein [Methanocaldococcus villosus KIN24-T80]
MRKILIPFLLISSLILFILSLYYSGTAESITTSDVNNFIIYKIKSGINYLFNKHVFDTYLSEKDRFKFELLEQYRFPPTIGAIFVGIILSASGLMLQTLFRNLLASPYTTGISSGVLLIAVLVIFNDSLSKLMISLFGGKYLVVAGWIGGIISMLMLLIIAYRVRESNGVLIVALLLTYFFSGIRAFYISQAEDIKVHEYYGYVIGNLKKITLNDLPIMAICTIIFLIALIFLVKPLNALLFGERYAKSFGLDIKKIRILILLTTCFAVGSIIPFVGLMAFVGIVSPYLARIIIKTSDHKYLLPTTMLLGVNLLLFCHILTVKYASFLNIKYAPPLPIGSLLDIIGGLLVIYLIFKEEKKIVIQ